VTRAEFESKLSTESHRWIGVSYVHNGRSHSQGIDCLGLIVILLQSTGLQIRDGDGMVYNPDWFLHTPEERYMEGIKDQGIPVERNSLRPGDVIFFRPGILGGGGLTMITHGGIYLGGGRFVHCMTNRSVTISLLKERAWDKSYGGAVRPKALLSAIGETV